MAETSTKYVSKPKVAAWSQIQSLLNTINHILIVLIALFVTVLANSLDFKDTAMHMFMTTIGFHVLAAEALMSHYPINPLTNRFSHRTKSRIHSVLQIVGGSMALLGGIGKISQTEVHFTTWHGKLGLAAVIMCCASMLGGIINYFQPKFAHKVYPASEIKYRHNMFGMVTFLLAMGTIYLGYGTRFFYKYVDAEFIPVFSLTTVLVTIFTMIGPIRALMDKSKFRNTRKSKY